MKTTKGKNGGTLKSTEKGDVLNPKGKPEGTKNRATILKQFLGLKLPIKNPATGETEKHTFEEIIELAILKKAGSGDVNAYKEIKDTLYGKLTEKTELSGEVKTDLSKYNAEELLKIAETYSILENQKGK